MDALPKEGASELGRRAGRLDGLLCSRNALGLGLVCLVPLDEFPVRSTKQTK
jgi:hypothetical protein